jgi:hypothetical protein
MEKCVVCGTIKKEGSARWYRPRPCIDFFLARAWCYTKCYAEIVCCKCKDLFDYNYLPLNDMEW